jgi:ABC-type transporter Mla MlaB component
MACFLLVGECEKKAMLRIQRSSNKGVTFTLSGRIEAEDIVELQRLLSLEAADLDIAFDLQDITQVDRDAVKFLAHCEAESIKLESCPAYIREWIDTERGGGSRQKR